MAITLKWRGDRKPPKNFPPTITGNPVNGKAGVAYTWMPTASDPDGDTNLTFQIENKPTWASFSTTTGRIYGTPTTAASHTDIIITVTDSQGASASLGPLTITIAAADQTNRAPTISGTAPATITVGGSYNFQPTAADPDGDTLVFTIQNKPSWATFSTSTGRLSGTPSAAGSHTNIIISVSDGTLSASLAAFTITVSNVNSAPVLSSENFPRTIVEGEQYWGKVTATDPDGDVIEYTATGVPSWLTWDADKHTLFSGAVPSSAVGTHGPIVIKGNDGRGGITTLVSFSVVVEEASTTPTNVRHWRGGHWLFMARNKDYFPNDPHVTNPKDLNERDNYVAKALSRFSMTVGGETIQACRGIVKRFLWRELELWTTDTTNANGSGFKPNGYAFNSASHELTMDLAWCEANAMPFILFIEDRTFFNAEKCHPEYMSKYSVLFTSNHDDDGYNMARWDPYYTARFNALMDALYAKFKDNPYFYGVMTSETSLGLDNKTAVNANKAYGRYVPYHPVEYMKEYFNRIEYFADACPKWRYYWTMNFVLGGNSLMAKFIDTMTLTSGSQTYNGTWPSATVDGYPPTSKTWTVTNRRNKAFCFGGADAMPDMDGLANRFGGLGPNGGSGTVFDVYRYNHGQCPKFINVSQDAWSAVKREYQNLTGYSASNPRPQNHYWDPWMLHEFATGKIPSTRTVYQGDPDNRDPIEVNMLLWTNLTAPAAADQNAYDIADATTSSGPIKSVRTFNTDNDSKWKEAG